MNTPVPKLALLIRSVGPALGLAAAWILFAFLVPDGRFRTWETTRLMLVQTSVVASAAVGATLVIASRGIDLAVGSTVALCTMVIALAVRCGVGPTAAAGLGIASGALVGVLTGLMVVGRVVPVALALGLMAAGAWIAGPWAAAAAFALAAPAMVLTRRVWPRLELSSFIVTLGLWGILRGIAKWIGDNQPIYPNKPEDAGWMPALMGIVGGEAGPWRGIGGVVVTLVLAALIGLLIARTVVGRRALAIGDNETAARYAGVPVDTTKVIVFAISSACAGVAGVLQFGSLGVGDPTTAAGLELQVIAAAVIGGASLSGGSGSVLGTLVGAMLMTVVATGCTKLGLANYVQEVVTGAIIVAAVAIDRARRAGGVGPPA